MLSKTTKQTLLILLCSLFLAVKCLRYSPPLAEKRMPGYLALPAASNQ